MSLILGFINFHVLREVYAIFFSITSFMNFQLRRAGNSTDEIPMCWFRRYKNKKKSTKEVVRQLGAIWGQDRGWSCAS